MPMDPIQTGPPQGQVLVDGFWGGQPLVPDGSNLDGAPWLDLEAGLDDVDWVSEAP